MGLNEKLFRLYELLRAGKMKLATAESCTGGMIGSMLTEVPGISECYEYGFITYSNEAKVNMLGVRPETIRKYGAVSAETAREMAQGALEKSGADIAVSVTGNAGPSAGEGKPVGLIFVSMAEREGGTVTKKLDRDCGRIENRRNAAETAVDIAIDFLKNNIELGGTEYGCKG